MEKYFLNLNETIKEYLKYETKKYAYLDFNF